MVSYWYQYLNTFIVDNSKGQQTFLPERIRTYLNGRGLHDTILEHNKITWDGERIVIPIFNADGIWLFNKYRRDPAVSEGPKYTYDAGSHSSLYGIDKLPGAAQVIICEGEFDALILEANGFVGVTSTGGAGTFKQEWLDLMTGKELFMCFDNDEAGRKGMVKLTKMNSLIKCIPLVRDLGEHGDITDFFTHGGTKKDFEILMKVARPLELPPEPQPTRRKGNNGVPSHKLEQAKEVDLDKLLKFNRGGFAACPFHNEKTASLHWIKKSNKWYCFGCGEKGDGIDLAMKLQGFSKIQEAMDYLLSL
jgi:CHC2-type zinc finger protein/Toprim domain-containing protein